MGDHCYRYLVSGRVQGVFFRASTAREARALGISGHAINLADGRVEVLAYGPAEALEALGRWLRRGPPAARVDELTVEKLDCARDAPGSFRTG